MVSEDDVTLMCQGVVRTNTKLNNELALNNLKEWMKICANSDEPVPDDLLSNPDPFIHV